MAKPPSAFSNRFDNDEKGPSTINRFEREIVIRSILKKCMEEESRKRHNLPPMIVFDENVQADFWHLETQKQNLIIVRQIPSTP
jgi:hypothetical protein